MAQKLKITIRDNLSRGRGNSKSFVEPGHIRAKKAEALTWEAKDTDATLFFPHRELFGVREVDIEKESQKTLNLSESLNPGRYPYAIYCPDSGDFAEGGSFPIIIIDE